MRLNFIFVLLIGLLLMVVVSSDEARNDGSTSKVSCQLHPPDCTYPANGPMVAVDAPKLPLIPAPNPTTCASVALPPTNTIKTVLDGTAGGCDRLCEANGHTTLTTTYCTQLHYAFLGYSMAYWQS